MLSPIRHMCFRQQNCTSIIEGKTPSAPEPATLMVYCPSGATAPRVPRSHGSSRTFTQLLITRTSQEPQVILGSRDGAINYTMFLTFKKKERDF